MYLKNKFTNRSIIILQNPFKNILTFKGYYYKRLHKNRLLKNRRNNNDKSRYKIDKNQHSLYKSKQYYLNILKKNKILFYYINEQLDLKIKSKTSTGIIKMYIVLLRFIKRVLKFLLSKLTFYRILILLTITILIFLITYKNELNKKFERIVIKIIIHKVLKNKHVIDKISYEIMQLTKQEKTKKLMRDLILKDILPNKEMKEDL